MKNDKKNDQDICSMSSFQTSTGCF
jgi:hypothetical protein